MNRLELLKTVRGLGYKSDAPTLDDVLKYVTESNIVIMDGGVAVDITKAWNTKAVTKVETSADGEEEQEEAPRKKPSAKTLDTEAKMNKARGSGDTETKGPQRFQIWIEDAHKKAYKARVARGQATFADADACEIFGAFVRLGAMDFKHVGDYFGRTRDVEIVKTMVEYDNANAGVLVPPPELSGMLVWNRERFGVAKRLADVFRLPAGGTRRARKTSEFALGWVAEMESLPALNNAYDGVQHTPHKLGGIFAASNEQLQDSAINIGEEVGSSAQYAYEKAIDDAYFNGDGTDTYGGVTGLTNSANVATITATGHATFAATDSGDFQTAIGSIVNCDWGNVAWVGSRQAIMQTMGRINIGATQVKDIFSMMDPSGAGPHFDFNGTRGFFAQSMNATTGSSKQVAFVGDFMGGSQIGERLDLTVTPSQEAGFSSDSFQWRITARASIIICGDGKGGTTENIVELVTG